MTGLPFIPEYITVHLGAPDSNAENVTLPFVDYVKNVASSEIYPTWPESSLRANIYAIVTFALNRIYTEWYKSRGYNFDITNNTQFDQKFINGRQIYDSVSVITDELFNDYIRRQGSVEPLFSAFCNGTTVTCDGLSQWGTVGLAQQGLTPYEILQSYYGDDIELVFDADVRINTPSYPGRTLYEGLVGDDVRTIQLELNRISSNYPAIPKIPEPDGVYGAPTTAAVRKFQQIFNLPQTGNVDKATWYKIGYLYTAVKKLAELSSEGVSYEDIKKQYVTELRKGDQNDTVRILQYFLKVVGAFYDKVMPVETTGYFGDETENSVISFQKVFGLPQTGVVDRTTWFEIYNAYVGIAETLPFEGIDVALYPGTVLKEGSENVYVRIIQQYLNYISRYFPEIPELPVTGYYGPQTRDAVYAFQSRFGIPIDGEVNSITWDTIAGIYSDVRFGEDKRPYQYPGYVIR